MKSVVVADLGRPSTALSQVSRDASLRPFFCLIDLEWTWWEGASQVINGFNNTSHGWEFFRPACICYLISFSRRGGCSHCPRDG